MKTIIATPCYGGQLTEPYFQSVLNLITRDRPAGEDISVMTSSGESLITRARNVAVATFMNSDWDAILFIDSDIQFDPRAVWRLVKSGYPLCAAPYPLKTLDWAQAITQDEVEAAKVKATRLVIDRFPDEGFGEDGFLKVRDTGTGFMLIHREVFESIKSTMPELEYTSDQMGTHGDTHYAYFDTAIRDGRYLSEDYEFCHRARDVGYDVMLDVKGPLLHHHGHYAYGV